MSAGGNCPAFLFEIELPNSRVRTIRLSFFNNTRSISFLNLIRPCSSTLKAKSEIPKVGTLSSECGCCLGWIFTLADRSTAATRAGAPSNTPYSPSRINFPGAWAMSLKVQSSMIFAAGPREVIKTRFTPLICSSVCPILWDSCGAQIALT